MKKYVSLIKATFSDGMALFKVSTNKMNPTLKKLLPYILFILVLYSFTYYTCLLTKQLNKVGLAYLVISLFAFLTFFLTIMEGIYKSGDLLFNCKDDDLLLSLPIKKSTVLFVRFFKFYVFELIYNSLYMIPAIISFAIYAKPGWLFYVISVLMCIVLPVIPVLISVIIGFITKQIITQFKYKNLAQIIFTSVLLLGIMYVSFNAKEFVNKLINNASSIFDLIKKIYYPAYLYYELFTDFKFYKLAIYLIINIILVVIVVNILSKLYYKINSRTKEVSNYSKNKNYKIKVHNQFSSFIYKELKRLTTTPVFIINACFGLVLFLASAILLTSKSATFIKMMNNYGFSLTTNIISKYIPLVLLGMIAFAALTSSTTSSMVSLEGKSFNILKSLPIKPQKVLYAKIFTGLLLMVPIIIIGDIIVFCNFDFNIMQMVLLLLLSFTLPLISTQLGIFFNVLYPHMDFDNDTEVVKQSMSVMIAIFANFGVLIIIGILMYFGIKRKWSSEEILTVINLLSIGINMIAMVLIKTIGVKNYQLITV